MSIKNKVITATVAGMMAIATPLIAVEEGLSVIPYQDIGGVWTWCYGETEGPRPTHTLTEQECGFMLRAKIYTIGLAVWYLIDLPMTNARWASLTSFTYNLGIGAFRGSTLRRRLNAGDPNACDEMRRWIKIGPKDCTVKSNGCSGLPARREKERSLCYQ